MNKIVALAVCFSLSASADQQQTVRAHILFNATVDEASVEVFAEQLDAAVRGGATEVLVEINTPGGSVSEGMKMSKMIEASPAPVICVVDGMAASMGLYILQSCDVRVMTSRSLLMGHQPAAGIQAQPDEVAGLAEMLLKLGHAMACHITHQMHINVEQYEALTAHGHQWWLTADDALGVGAIDGIVIGTRGL